MWIVRDRRSGQLVRVGNSLTGMVAARLYMNSDYTLQTSSTHMRVDNLAKHEASHSFGMSNCTAGRTNNPIAVICENSFSTYPGGNYVITQCDIEGINRVYCPVTPTPTPTPSGGGQECDPFCDVTVLTENNLSGEETSNSVDLCCLPSPIIIDILGNGYDLTDSANGVMFDFNGDGVSHRISWTSADSDDAWLVLDRNEDGLINSSHEMFGNMTEQSFSSERNGFRALAEFDKTSRGGNADDKINRQDAIFNSLKLWRDVNHNGISEASELFELPSLDVRGIDLDYKTSRRTDEHGNRFKYRAKVRDATGASVGRWAWDVFLVLETPQN